MKQTNCLNCGAPYYVELNKCPYCGTNYFDLSFIDFDATEPFYIKIKKTLRYSQKTTPVIITLRVLPEAGELNMERNEIYCCGGPNNTHRFSAVESCSTNLSLGFQCIPNEKGELGQFNIEE